MRRAGSHLAGEGPSSDRGRMTEPAGSASEHLEEARELLWQALETLEEAQRALFRAGDCYVAAVCGDGVRAVIELTERITALAGDLTGVPLEIGRLARHGPEERGR